MGAGQLLEASEEGCDEESRDAAVQAVVLTGSARAFSAGADVTEFGTPKAGREPNLRTVIDVIENSPKPVVAAINGHALGGGWGWRGAATHIITGAMIALINATQSAQV